MNNQENQISLLISINNREFRSKLFLFLQLCNRNLLSFYNSFIEENKLKNNFNKYIDEFLFNYKKENGKDFYHKKEEIINQRENFSLDLYDNSLFPKIFNNLKIFNKKTKKEDSITKSGKFDNYIKENFYIRYIKNDTENYFSFKDESFQNLWGKYIRIVRNNAEHYGEGKNNNEKKKTKEPFILSENEIRLILSFLLPNQREQFINLIKNYIIFDPKKIEVKIEEENKKLLKPNLDKNQKYSLEEKKERLNQIKNSIEKINRVDGTLFGYLAKIRDEVTESEKRTAELVNSDTKYKNDKEKKEKELKKQKNKDFQEEYTDPNKEGKLSTFLRYFNFIGENNFKNMKTFFSEKGISNSDLLLEDYIKLNQLDFDIRLILNIMLFNITPSIKYKKSKEKIEKEFGKALKETTIYNEATEEEKGILNKFIKIRNGIAHNNPIYKNFEKDINTIFRVLNFYVDKLKQIKNKEDKRVFRFVKERNNLYVRLESLFREVNYKKLQIKQEEQDINEKRELIGEIRDYILCEKIIKRWHTKPKGKKIIHEKNQENENKVNYILQENGIRFHEGSGIYRDDISLKNIENINKKLEEDYKKNPKKSTRPLKDNQTQNVLILSRKIEILRDKKVSKIAGNWKNKLKEFKIEPKSKIKQKEKQLV